MGRSANLDRLPGFLGDMVELCYEIEDLVVDGSAVAAFYTMTAKWQGEAPISIRGVQRLVIADGLIRPPHGLLGQSGLSPAGRGVQYRGCSVHRRALVELVHHCLLNLIEV